jgi:hypothetical protein
MWERGSVQMGNCRGYRVDFIGRGGREGATTRATMAINGHGGGRLLQGNQWGRLIEVKRKRVKEGE